MAESYLFVFFLCLAVCCKRYDPLHQVDWQGKLSQKEKSSKGLK